MNEIPALSLWVEQYFMIVKETEEPVVAVVVKLPVNDDSVSHWFLFSYCSRITQLPMFILEATAVNRKKKSETEAENISVEKVSCEFSWLSKLWYNCVQSLFA